MSKSKSCSNIGMKCFILDCPNNKKPREKVKFTRVPLQATDRVTWFKRAFNLQKKIPVIDNSDLFCCEDHFDHCDFDHRSKSATLKLKRGVFPHKFPYRTRPKRDKRSDEHSYSTKANEVDSVETREDIKVDALKSQSQVDTVNGLEDIQTKPSTISGPPVLLNPNTQIVSTPVTVTRGVTPLVVQELTGSSNTLMTSTANTVVSQGTVLSSHPMVLTSSTSNIPEPVKKKKKVVKEILAWIPSDTTTASNIKQGYMKPFLLMQSPLVQPMVTTPVTTPTILHIPNATSEPMKSADTNRLCRAPPPLIMVKPAGNTIPNISSVLIKSAPLSVPVIREKPPLKSTTQRRILPSLTPDHSITDCVESSPGLNMVISEFNIMRNTIAQLNAEVQSLKCTIEKLQAKNGSVNHFNSSEIQKEKEVKSKQLEEEICTILEGCFSKNQVKMLMCKHRPTRVKWTEKEIDMALTLRNISPKAYRYVRTVLKIPLPTPLSIRRFKVLERKTYEKKIKLVQSDRSKDRNEDVFIGEDLFMVSQNSTRKDLGNETNKHFLISHVDDSTTGSDDSNHLDDTYFSDDKSENTAHSDGETKGAIQSATVPMDFLEITCVESNHLNDSST